MLSVLGQPRTALRSVPSMRGALTGRPGTNLAPKCLRAASQPAYIRSPVATRAQINLRRAQAEAALNLSRIQREMERRLASMLASEKLENVTPAQANALMILFQEKGSLTARQLAAQMNLSEVTVGRFVRALESANWVVRKSHPSDSRAILISPSRKAYRAFQRFLRVSNGLLEEAFAGFTKKQVEQMVGMLEQMRGNLSEEG